MGLGMEWEWAASVLAVEWVQAAALVMGWGGGLPHMLLQKSQLHRWPP